MSVRKDYLQGKKATLSMLAALCVFSSCASSTSETANPPLENPPSDSALLDDSAKVGATSVDDSAAFADLESAKEKKPEADSASAASAPSDAPGEAFYNSLGGESLRRVAFTLYSDKAQVGKLLEKNPDLKGVKKLGAEQKVFFDMDSVKPEPTYLTKDLLNRYAASLADRLASSVTEKGITKTTVTVNKGESLQDVSMRLYGTHRYWTEIFLVNHDKIQNFDKVKAGMTLSVFNRPNTGIAKSEGPSEPPVASTEEKAPAPERVVEAKPVPVVAPVAVTTPEPTPAPAPVPTQPEPPVAVQPPPKDPIPETPAPPPVVEKVAPVAMDPPKPMKAPDAVMETPSANSSLRRILYVALILMIGGAAFYFTRTPKRAKVDMLDLNADAGARPKLATKDSQKHNIG